MKKDKEILKLGDKILTEQKKSNVNHITTDFMMVL